MANEQNLLKDTAASVFRGQGGRLESSRAARGREFATELLSRPAYRRSLYKRILSGKAPLQEQYLLEMLYGKVPKPRADDEDTELKARFERLREELNYLLSEHPELARSLAAAVAKRSAKLLPMPVSPRALEVDDEIL